MRRNPLLQGVLLTTAALASLHTTATPSLSQDSPPEACRTEGAYKNVINQYLDAMENHSVAAIEKLFTEDGTVVSTSVGNADAVAFYKKFFPEIKTAKTKLLETYRSTTNPNLYGASFIFTFTTHDGTTEGGAYADEFYFAPSCKLRKVVMYENMKTNR